MKKNNFLVVVSIIEGRICLFIPIVADSLSKLSWMVLTGLNLLEPNLVLCILHLYSVCCRH